MDPFGGQGEKFPHRFFIIREGNPDVSNPEERSAGQTKACFFM
jgi:hypothetical protein